MQITEHIPTNAWQQNADEIRKLNKNVNMHNSQFTFNCYLQPKRFSCVPPSRSLSFALFLPFAQCVFDSSEQFLYSNVTVNLHGK